MAKASPLDRRRQQGRHHLGERRRFHWPGSGLLRKVGKTVMLESKFLRSKVARRFFMLFIACALAPMAVFTTPVVHPSLPQLRTQNQRQLQQSAKSLGLAIYERLTILDADLQVASLRIQRGDPSHHPLARHTFRQ